MCPISSDFIPLNDPSGRTIEPPPSPPPPSLYRSLDYIDTTGYTNTSSTIYVIDTGYVPNNYSRVDMIVTPIKNEIQFHCGCLYISPLVTWEYRFHMGLNSAANWSGGVRYSGPVNLSYNGTVGVKQRIGIDSYKNRFLFCKPYNASAQVYSYYCGNPMVAGFRPPTFTIFGRHDRNFTTTSVYKDRGQFGGNIKVHRVLIYEKNKLIRDMVPVSNTSTNKKGLYDNKTKKFYTFSTLSTSY